MRPQIFGTTDQEGDVMPKFRVTCERVVKDVVEVTMEIDAPNGSIAEELVRRGGGEEVDGRWIGCLVGDEWEGLRPMAIEEVK